MTRCEAVSGADAVYTDVWLSMTDDPETAAARRHALAPYRLDDALLDRAAPHAVALHCLPAHVGEEITEERPLREPRAHLGPGRKPSTRPEGAARAARARQLRPEWNAHPPRAHAARGDELELTDRLARLRRRRGRAAGRAMSCSSRGAVPGDVVRAVIEAASAPTPRRGRWRSSSRARPDRAGRRPSRARRGRCSPTNASSRSSRSRSTTRCGGSDASSGYELEPIVPAVEQWRYRNKLEYSFGIGPDGRLVCGFHAPGHWERDRRDRRTACSPPSAATRPASRWSRWCREQGLSAV